VIWLGEYIRMVCYGFVLTVSIFNVFGTKRNWLVIGNLAFAVGSFFSLFYPIFFGTEYEIARVFTLTPTAILWAVFNFIYLVKR